MRDTIRLEGLAFDGRHGLLPAERDTGTRFRVDIELEVDLSVASRSDRLADTIDYRHVAELVDEINRGNSFHLIERLAGALADGIIERFEPVEVATVEVHKLVPVLACHPESVAVVITRSR